MPRTLALLCCGLLALPSAAGEPPWVVPVEGTPFRAPFIAADGRWNLRFGSMESARELAAKDLVVWGAFVEPLRGPEIILAGDGLIVAEDVRIEKEQLSAESAALGHVKLPLELCCGVVFRPPFDRAAHDRLLMRVRSPDGKSDRVLLDNGDELAGTIELLDSDPVGGVALRLRIEPGGVETRIDQERLAAIIFNPSLVDRPQPSGLRVLVGLRDGSYMTAVELALAASSATIKLAGGITLTTRQADFAAIFPLGGQATYLSDLKPSSFRHIPFLQLSWPYQNDRSVSGSSLRVGGNLVPKGLGMHAPARITYDLERPYRRFQAEAAIDDESKVAGSVVFRVFTDEGNGTWQERHFTTVVRGGDAPVPISVDLTDVKRLSLLVDYADRGDEQDHADWLNARLVP